MSGWICASCSGSVKAKGFWRSSPCHSEWYAEMDKASGMAGRRSLGFTLDQGDLVLGNELGLGMQAEMGAGLVP